MSTTREFHNKAMNLAQLALIAREAGETAQAILLANEAYELESKAAELVPPEISSEPTRSILYLSAASLAYQAKKFGMALRLIGKGISGYPSPESLEELKALWEQVTFEEHLQVKGIELAPEDLQMSIEGKVVGSGMVFYDEFLDRIQALNSIINRTVQRKSLVTYQRAGRIAGSNRYFTPALSAPRPGSFAITIRLVFPQEYQSNLLCNAQDIIDDILTGIDHINKGDEKAVRDLISSEPYYVNFVSQTKKLAPDGENVSLVGLTSGRRKIGLTKIQKEIRVISETKDTEPVNLDIVRIQGILDYAKSRGTDQVGLTADDGRRYSVYVREGMDDLVKSYFDQKVSIMGSFDRVKRRLYLTEIDFANTSETK